MRAQKKRILHLIDTTGAAGAETVFFNIVQGLNPDKYDSFILLPEKGWLYDRLLQVPNLEVNLLYASGRVSFLLIYQLFKFVKINRINIIHSHLFGTALYGSIVGILCRIPVICTFHGFIDIDLNDRLLKLKFFIISIGAKRIVAVSDYLRKYLEGKLPLCRKDCVTIFNGIALNERATSVEKDILRRRFGFSESDILVGSVGNIKKVKGYDILLKAAIIVKKRYPNCYFLVAGKELEKTFLSELLMERQRLNLEKEFHFIGFQEDVWQFLHMLDIFVLPSITEGFSLSTIEAMEARLPVVVTKSGGPQEIVINNKNGILVNVGDELDLASGLIRLIENRELREKLVAAATKTIFEKFQMNKMIQEYEYLYSTLTKNAVF